MNALNQRQSPQHASPHERGPLGCCPVCGSASTHPRLDYLRCSDCGHEVLEQPQQTFITNEVLDADRIRATSLLDRHQVALARKLLRGPGTLVDVGCGPGRFLWHVRKYVDRAVGVEITQECIDFARNTLGLDVRTSWPADAGSPSLITFWHSLEHMPMSAIAETLNSIAKIASSDTVVLISVPNADSWLASVFGRKNTYYDNPNHIHQFTPSSLDTYLLNHGFERTGKHPSFIYSWAGWSLSLLSVMSPRHNYFYYTRKRGADYGFSPAKRRAWNVLLSASAPLAAAFGGLLALLDAAKPEKSALVQHSYQLRRREAARV